MKSESIQQFAIVRTDSAVTFEEQLNARIRELAEHRPVVAFSDADPFYARISYTVSSSVPESLADEYELRGVHLTCQDCPCFEPIIKADGTEDKRIKWGDCQYAHYGRTSRNAAVCDRLFEMLNSGEVRLCLAR